MSRIHLSFDTTDLDRSIAFFGALLGSSPDKLRDGYARFAPENVPVVLTLNRSDREGLNHLGLRVDEAAQVAAAIGRAQSAGLAHRVQEQTTCCYAVQDKVWLEDPAGIDWEVYRVTDDGAAAYRDDKSTCCAPSASPDSVAP